MMIKSIDIPSVCFLSGFLGMLRIVQYADYELTNANSFFMLIYSLNISVFCFTP